MFLRFLAAAVIETNLVYPIGVNNNKIITGSNVRIGASIASTMAELNAQANVL
jgi:hypothetical protein